MNLLNLRVDFFHYGNIKNGKFTYYSDWNGFNIPYYVLCPFFKGKFNPLSGKEQKILEIFKNIKGKYYIIAVHGDIKIENNGLLKHEIAHALYYISNSYSEKISNILKKYDNSKLKRWLLKTGGYNVNVFDDEIQAYFLQMSKLPNLLMMG
jgi:hypothetical protein